MVTAVTAAQMRRTAKYFIIFTPKCFALAVAATSAKLRAILLNKICKTVQFLHCFVNSALAGHFCTKFCACRITEFWHPYLFLWFIAARIWLLRGYITAMNRSTLLLTNRHVFGYSVAPEPWGTGGARAPPLFQMAGHGGHRGRTFNYHNLL